MLVVEYGTTWSKHVRQATKRVFAAAVSTALLALPGAPAALAHGGRHNGPPPIQGMLTNVSAGSVQVQTQASNVTVPITGSTHVVRVVSGSLADLHPNQHVEVHLVSGTKTVDSIQIDGSKWYRDIHIHADLHWSPRRTPGNISFEPRHPKPKTVQRPNVSPSGFVGGQLVSLGGHSLTLAITGNKQVTYTLASSLAVTKIMNGTTGDLSFGETVRVTRDHSGNAACIVILSA